MSIDPFLFTVSRASRASSYIGDLLGTTGASVRPGALPVEPRDAVGVHDPRGLQPFPRARPMVVGFSPTRFQSAGSPSLSASRIATSPHRGLSKAFTQTGDPDQHVKRADRQGSPAGISSIAQSCSMFAVHYSARGCPVRACICQVFGHCASVSHGTQALRGSRRQPDLAPPRPAPNRSTVHFPRGEFRSECRPVQWDGMNLSVKDTAGLFDLPPAASPRQTPISGAWRLPFLELSKDGCPYKRQANPLFSQRHLAAKVNPVHAHRIGGPTRGCILPKTMPLSANEFEQGWGGSPAARPVR